MDTASSGESSEGLDYAIKRNLLAKSKLVMINRRPGGVVSYCCVECSAKYENKGDMEQHLQVHYREYRYLCGICGTGLKRKEHLERHTMEHQEVRPHVCPECSKAFKRKEHLNIHMSIHSGDKSESCPVCDKSFYRKDHLRKHIQTHSKALIDYKKSLNLEFVDVKEEILDEQIKQIDDQDSEDQDEDMSELAEQDQKEYMTSEQVSGLSITTPYTTERPFQCNVCQKSYKRRDHLKIHTWSHMKKDKMCAQCGKSFHLEDQLLMHLNTHNKSALSEHSDEDQHLAQTSAVFGPVQGLLIARAPPARQTNESRPHACPICERRFKRKQHLKVHMNVHTKHQPSIWCSVCGEGFLTNPEFESHHCLPLEPEVTTEVYEDEPILPVQQEAKKENKYPDEFIDIEILPTLTSQQHQEETNHIDNYEEELALPTPQRVFVCKYCSKPFKRKDHYKIHLHIHTGIKSFFCPDCGKGFYRKDHMQKHMLVHNKTKPKKEIPDLFPINMFAKKEVKPEITIHAPSNTKLRVPLQIKVPYQMVMSLGNGEQRAVTIDPQSDTDSQ